MNNMNINGYDAVISYDPEINMFRGEFVGINGGADFYASTVDDLRKEGEISLRAFLEMCAEDGVEPRKHFSGKFNLRVPPALHQRLAAQAAAHGKSINAWIPTTFLVYSSLFLFAVQRHKADRPWPVVPLVRDPP